MCLTLRPATPSYGNPAYRSRSGDPDLEMYDFIQFYRLTSTMGVPYGNESVCLASQFVSRPTTLCVFARLSLIIDPPGSQIKKRISLHNLASWQPASTDLRLGPPEPIRGTLAYRTAKPSPCQQIGCTRVHDNGPSRYIRRYDYLGSLINLFLPSPPVLSLSSRAVLNPFSASNLQSRFIHPSAFSLAMLGLSKIFLLALAATTAQAAPVHNKRIAQVIVDSTAKWEAACVRLSRDRRWGYVPTSFGFFSSPREARRSVTLSP